MRRKPLEGWPGALVVVLCALVHASGLDGAFVFDDEIAIVQNEDIGALWPPSVPLSGPHESPSSGRPLVALSLALNHAAGGLDPRGYHLVNLAIHVLVCLLLWRVATALFARTPRTQARAPGLGLSVALLFAVHPIATSAVTYVSQRAESLAALFTLAALLAWIRHLDGTRPRSGAPLAVLCCYLALLSKETGYAIPFIAVLLERAFFAPSWRAVWRQNGRAYLAMASSWVVLAAGLALGARGATVSWSYRDYDSWTYLLTSSAAIVHYLRLMFWPHPLVLDHGWPIARSLSEVGWQFVALGAAFLASLASLTRAPRVAFLGLSFFLILAPSSSVVPVVTEVMAEHRMYLGSAIVIALSVLAVDRFLARWYVPVPAARVAVGAGLVGLLIPLAQVTREQNALYSDPIRMYAHNVEHTPDNYRAHYNLGYHLSRADRYADARAALERAVRIDPTYAPAHRELSYVAVYTGDPRAALGHIDTALALEPEDRLNRTAKGAFLALLGRPEEGLGWIDGVLADEPGFREALKWRVNVLLLAQRGPAADRALAEYDPALGPAERQRELQARYRDLMQMVRASERP